MRLRYEGYTSFIEDMDKVVNDTVAKHIKTLIKSIVIISGELETNKDKVIEVFSKHLNFDTKDLGILVSILEEDIRPVKCDYTYKGLVINPEGYYILKEDHRQPSQIEILEQCVKQNTHKPNIRPLQEGYASFIEYMDRKDVGGKKW